MSLNILLTLEEGETRDVFFPPAAMEALRSLGTLTLNGTGEPFAPEELTAAVAGVDVCVTHWGCPAFTEEVLCHADRLRLIAHAAGSVRGIASEESYRRGIKVCSANRVMAQNVAESALAYMLAGLKMIPLHDVGMKQKALWDRRYREIRNLRQARIGMIGLGTVGVCLLDLLKPFDVTVKLYDPYIDMDSLKEYPFVASAGLNETLAYGDIVTLHASLTNETQGLLSAEKLELIRDGALFVNTARGAIVDEQALASALASGRFGAVLDVYTQEPLDPDSPLRGLPNVILQPHLAGAGVREEMTFAMIEEIRRMMNGEPLHYEIPYGKFIHMTGR